MKKKTPSKKRSSSSSPKSSTKNQTPRDANYWIDRTVTDSHRDWAYNKDTWIDDYKASVDHPHRKRIIEALESFPWSYLLEVGCSVGPNLKLIRDRFPDKALFGVDVNPASIHEAEGFLDPTIEVRVASLDNLPYPLGMFDVILADASLMYTSPENIQAVMDDLCARAHNLIIVDRYADSQGGKPSGNVWARDYLTLLTDRGFSVTLTHLTAEDWPDSEGWQKQGCIYVAARL